MVNEKFIIENKKPVETVYELKDEYKIPSFEEFDKTYKGGVNYDDLNSGDIGTNKGYGPTNDGANCYKYCYYCRKDVSVSSYSSTYCPHCGTAFGDVTKKTTGLQKLNSDAGQRVVNNYGDRVERSGGEVKVKIGDEDVEITYKRN
jgi:hypothetical protein